MPTYSFTRTVPQLVAKVLRKLGAIGIDETASSEDTVVVREAMDLRLKELHALGTLWFNVAPAATDLSLSAGVATASLPAEFLFPVSVMLRINGEDRPVEIVTHDRYQAIENKADTGEPKLAYFGPNSTVYFHPVPNAAYTAKLTHESIAEDTEPASAPDVPVSMMNAFTDLIAADLVDEFDVPEPKATRILRRGELGKQTLKTLNSPRVDNATVEIESF